MTTPAPRARTGTVAAAAQVSIPPPTPIRPAPVEVSRAPAVGAARFRHALARHAAGVVVVTGPGPVGLTATSFTSVSLDPPLVSFYVAETSTTWPDLSDAEVFAINILGTDQATVGARFAERDVDRFAGPTRWHTGPYDVPILDGGAAHLVCEPYDTIRVGDHWLVVGLVIDTGIGPAETPLLYHRGRFSRLI